MVVNNGNPHNFLAMVRIIAFYTARANEKTGRVLLPENTGRKQPLEDYLVQFAGAMKR